MNEPPTSDSCPMILSMLMARKGLMSDRRSSLTRPSRFRPITPTPPYSSHTTLWCGTKSYEQHWHDAHISSMPPIGPLASGVGLCYVPVVGIMRPPSLPVSSR